MLLSAGSLGVAMKPTDAFRARNARADGGAVYHLPCGAIGCRKLLFHLARLEGFNGSLTTFGERLMASDGTKTLRELSAPVNKRLATTKKRAQSDEVADAIRALDARKAAMR